MARLHITWSKSTIGREEWQERIVRSLGLTRLHQTVEHEDTPTIRGMIQKVPHLLRVEEVRAEDRPAGAGTPQPEAAKAAAEPAEASRAAEEQRATLSPSPLGE